MQYSLYFAILLIGSCYAQAPAEHRSAGCQTRNAYYAVDGSCDAYVECVDYSPSHKQCPDGLHYDPKAVWPAYPCGYPTDITCEGRGVPQKPIATADCPHQFGFFPSPRASPSECGLYKMCVEGKPMEMMCPPGLAFNSVTSRCDWPDLVPTCNAEEFLGFKCPPVPLGDNNEPLDIVTNHKYEGNCFAFYSCEHGHARLLTCDAGMAFDPATGRCEDADKVKCTNPPMRID